MIDSQRFSLTKLYIIWQIAETTRGEDGDEVVVHDGLLLPGPKRGRGSGALEGHTAALLLSSSATVLSTSADLSSLFSRRLWSNSIFFVLLSFSWDYHRDTAEDERLTLGSAPSRREQLVPLGVAALRRKLYLLALLELRVSLLSLSFFLYLLRICYTPTSSIYSLAPTSVWLSLSFSLRVEKYKVSMRERGGTFSAIGRTIYKLSLGVTAETYFSKCFCV